MHDHEFLIGILTNVKPVGFIVLPYVCSRGNEKYIQIEERITPLNIDGYTGIHDAVKEIVTLSDAYSNLNLLKQFSKKKVSVKEFFEKMDNELLENRIRPFIDKRLSKIIRLLAENGIELYDGKAMPNLYPADRIRIEIQPADTHLKFTRTPEGTRYQLSAFHSGKPIQLKNPGNKVINNDPCWYLSDKHLYPFREEISGKLLSPFSRTDHIDIPKRLENTYFKTFIRKIINRSEVEAIGFQLNDLNPEPTALLSIELNWQGSAVLILSFVYGEKRILANDPQQVFTNLVTDDNGFIFNRFKRNKNWEQSKVRFLKSIGLHQVEALFKIKSQAQDSLPLSDFISRIAENRKLLEAEGFTIQQPSNVRYILEIPQLSMEVGSSPDWFDLYAVVLFGSFKIPFLQFKNHIINNIREYVLPGDEIIFLPDEWFARYQQLFFHAGEQGENIRISRQHYRILDDTGITYSRNPDEETESPEQVTLPELNSVTLRPYQQSGFFWLRHLCREGFGGILADDMGLGKTLQIIALLSSYYPARIQPALPKEKVIQTLPDYQLDLFSPAESFPQQQIRTKVTETKARPDCSLIVMPTSLIHNWLNEFRKISPGLLIYTYTGVGRKLSRSVVNNHDILITTYGTLRNDIEQLSKYLFEFAILDESQQIKNPVSQVAAAAYRIQSRHRLVMTGTPVENSLTDLWSQMHFVNPGLLGSLSDFTRYYHTPLLKNPADTVGNKLRTLIEPFILRRTKEAVAPELPQLTETISYCTMGEEQQQIYEAEKSKIRNSLLEKFAQNGVERSSVLVLRALMQLRQLANHPRMLNAESEAGSGKYEKVTDMLSTLLAENHKVLIFSSFIKHLALFEEYCREEGHPYALLKGSTTNREKVIESFRKNEDIRLFLISLKAGGVGLNLTEADYVFVLDPWWNPAAEMQAINRAHRIGQDKNVFVYRFISSDTVEEKILKLQEKKKQMADLFIRPASAFAGMKQEEILELFA